MKITRIDYLSSLEEINDIFNYNMDVCVTLEDGYTYVVVVGTPKNLLTLMKNENKNFLSPGDPIIIVKEMTKPVIEEALEAYAKEDNAYHLKFYSAELDTRTLDVLKRRSIAKDNILLNHLEKGNSIDEIENYSLIDFNINNL